MGSITTGSERAGVVRFGVYEADRRTGELRKAGVRIRLADQPFRVLIALVDRPGALVTREELRQLLWADVEAGNFEQGLNRAVNKVRVALSDSAANPRFIETLPGHGYRFVGEVERPLESTPKMDQAEMQARRLWTRAAIGAGVVGFAVAAALLVSYLVPEPVPDVRWRRLTTDNFTKMAPALSDGSRLYFLASYGGETFLVLNCSTTFMY